MTIATKQPQTGATPADPEHEADLTEEERRQRQIELNRPAIALLRSWIEDEQEDTAEEQRAALSWLMGAIDEDRPADRKLFS
jgi:hypothetical protein